MADKQFLRLSEKWALAYDRLQWILQEYGGQRKIGTDGGQEIWHARSFITDKKTVLLRVLREKGVEVEKAAQAYIDAMPDTFREWLEREQA